MDEKRAALSLVLCTSIFGLTFPLMKIALTHCGVVPFMALRFSVGGLLFLLLFGRRLRLLDRRGAAAGLLLGLCNFAAMMLQTAGLLYTSSVNSAFITATYVIFLPVYNVVRRGLRLRGKNIFALAAVFAGLAFVCGVVRLEPGAQELFTFNMGRINLGDAMTLLSSVLFGAYLQISDSVVKEYDNLALSTVTVCTIAALGLVSWCFVPASRADVMNVEMLLVVIVSGVFASGLCTYLIMKAQQHIGPVPLVILLSLEPVFAAIFALIIPIDGVRETMTVSSLLGCVLIFAAIMVSQLAGANAAERAADDD